jgi:hypothetical protein
VFSTGHQGILADACGDQQCNFQQCNMNCVFFPFIPFDIYGTQEE